jgi:hypothetical protein
VPIGEKMILDKINDLLKKLVILKNEETYWALTLWLAHTYAIKEFDFTPRLAIWSPEKRCGKSLLMEITSYLIEKPRMTSSISVSALFRTIEQFEGTVVFLDETDRTFGRDANREKANDLIQICNSGFKRGSTVIRTEGKDFKIKEFKVFCPVVLAGIGINSIPETIADRSILIEMRRKYPNESIQEFESDQIDEIFEPLRKFLREWIDENSNKFRQARPEMPSELNSRARDVWKGLFKIAESAGDTWKEKAWNACLVLQVGREGEDEVSWKLRLLEDIRRVFDGDRMGTQELLDALKTIEDASYKFNERFNSHYLSNGLKDYGIKSEQLTPRTTHGEEGKQYRGYRRSSFKEAWKRYLPEQSVITVNSVTDIQEEEEKDLWSS